MRFSKSYAIAITGSCQLMAGCGSVHKLTSTKAFKVDSIVSLNRDSLKAHTADSLYWSLDKSVVVTDEHVTNKLSLPGSYTAAFGKVGSVFYLASPDGYDSVVVSSDSGKIRASLRIAPRVIDQTINRTRREYKDVNQGVQTSSSDYVAGSIDSLDFDRVSVSSTSNKVDVEHPWRAWFLVGCCLIVVGALFYFHFRFKGK